MSAGDRAAPVAAALAALTTLACCLPLGFAGAAGLAAFSAWAGRWRGWFIAASLLLLAWGFLQLYRRRTCSRNRTSAVILWLCTLAVVAVFLFPQWVAAWFA